MLSDTALHMADGSPCAAFLGPAGVPRFVRMVHNSLAGADAEFVAETYHLLRSSLRMSHDEMRMVFSEWNRTELASYVLGITADVLGVRDEDGEALVEKVLDSAGQDLAGLQAAQAALELGCPAGLFADAAFARNLSALKDERVGASAVLGSAKAAATGERQAMIEDLRRALLAARIIGYSEGFFLLRRASEAYGWSLDLGRIAHAWREGCFVSASILDSIAEAYKRESGLASLLLDSRLKSALDASLPALRKTAARAIEQGIPVPGFASAISFFDGYRSTWLPASLIAAIKDRAASSGYERIDRPRGESFHSDWK
jgi:6-phosphogluconate dehydrogenase